MSINEHTRKVVKKNSLEKERIIILVLYIDQWLSLRSNMTLVQYYVELI